MLFCVAFLGFLLCLLRKKRSAHIARNDVTTSTQRTQLIFSELFSDRGITNSLHRITNSEFLIFGSTKSYKVDILLLFFFLLKNNINKSKTEPYLLAPNLCKSCNLCNTFTLYGSHLKIFFRVRCFSAIFVIIRHLSTLNISALRLLNSLIFSTFV